MKRSEQRASNNAAKPKNTQTQAKKPNNARILYLIQILAELTNETKGLSLPQIQEHLHEYGIAVERKSLYRDFDLLEEFGITVGKLPTRPVTYFLKTRLFEPAQMMLLIDAVQTSKSITKANATALVCKLKKLVSKDEARQLDARVHVAGRVKMQNESVFTTLDIIQRALSERRDIAFSYLQYDVEKNLCEIEAHDSKARVRTPLAIIYSDDCYYMITYDDATKDGVRVYRIDRMSAVRIGESSPKGHRLPAGFDIDTFVQNALGMYAGKPTSIKLLVAEDKIGNIIDLFGAENVECSLAKHVTETNTSHTSAQKASDRRWATMRVNTVPSPVLFGRIAQFAGDVRIAGPKRVVEAYDQHLHDVLAAQATLMKL